jgi:hypothetical protein
MKKLVTICMLFHAFTYAIAQERKYEISVGASNNGQIQSALDKFYYISDPLYVLPQSSNASSKVLKYFIKADIFLGKSIYVNLCYGNSKLNETYYYDITNTSGSLFEIAEEYGNMTNDQVNRNFNIGVGYHHPIGKFRFTTGFEIAFYTAKEFKSAFLGTQLVPTMYNNQQVLLTRSVKSTTIMPEGKAKAYNHVLEIDFLFSKRVAVGTSIHYGVVSAKFGDEVQYKNSYSYRPLVTSTGVLTIYPSNSSSREYKKYNVKYFSNPEFRFFLIFKFGKAII